MKTKNYFTAMLFLISSIVVAQDKKMINGVIVDQDGLPLIGATVLIQGTDKGVGADENGAFSLQVTEGQTLAVSYVFYQSQQIKIGKDNTYRIVMKTDDQVLDDIVVVAYGTTSKEAVTGAVAMVKPDEIAKRPATNALGALEGAAAGIRVNNTSGQPGAEPTIRIRGFSSLTSGGNDPLIVVDGVPFGGNISDLNPNDIESMSVLKDASSSTLYGNRASNGVVLITTKKASKGAGFFNVNIKQGLYNRGIKEYDRLGANDFMNVMWKGYRNSLVTDGKTLDQANQLANTTLISNILGLNIYNQPDDQLFENGQLRQDASILGGYAGDLDWYDPIERTGYYQDLNMSGRVANDKGGAYFSTGFLNNEGYFKKSDFKRFTARINADYQVREWLKVGGNINASHQESNGLSASAGDSGLYVNPFMYSRTIAPIYPVHKHDAATGEFVLDEFGNRIYDSGDDSRKQYEGRHVIWENELNSSKSYRTTVAGQFFAEFKFLNDFTFKVLGDLSLRNSENRTYDNAIIGDGAGNNGRSRRNNYRYKTYTAQQLLTYNKAFGDHSIEVLLGHENYHTEYNYLYAMKGNENFAGQDHLINFNDMTNLYDYINVYRTEGYLSRANYSYKNKYFADASFRRDASSKFHPDNRWGNFWSVGGSWVITNEDFFDVKAVDYLKLRASYGEVGNDGAADYYAFQDLYSILKNGGNAALYKSQIGNKDLQWETSSSFNIGLDARLFKRANVTVEYFDKRSQNLLFELKMPLSMGSVSTGESSPFVLSNVGSISNNGLELSFDVDVIKTEDWKWNIGANATWLKNKIVTLPAENRENGIISGLYKRVEGRSIYDFWLYQYAGVDQLTGDALYLVDDQAYNVNGSAPGKDAVPDEYLVQIGDKYYSKHTTYAKRDWSGNALPTVDGSFSTTLTYKNFSLNGLFTYGIGGKTYDYAYASLMSVSAKPGAIHSDVLGAWDGTPSGMTADSANRLDPNGIPVVDYTRDDLASATSSRFLQDGDYLVIKNVSINYDFPKDFLKKVNISKMSLNLGVENLYTFSKLQGMNPQQSFGGINRNGYVTPRTFILGLNVGF
ncbi:SusC/RagA family TonB-linked outer membrane protein [Myroides pelagicus]|uniref:SusC/RagA family TonB-linked outer membrane protein n=1 Tax=Myroides pelagicus TaxID=270914 RepID=UPI002DB8CE5C|nr:SusC/RagA family TonB-linked outer membrane protein [Myroides pelagicus]MEC4113399.1 SusC/RagA family TonB-linked outer membrane protein [Myroides pelagicus]